MRKFLFLAPALLLSPGCRPAAKSPSLLLVTLDTVRADRLGSYASPLGLTPELDALAAESVRFERVVAQTPLTTPSHASILTGLLPARHGIRNNESFSLSESAATLASRLKAAGYETAAFIGAFPLASRYGLSRGFDVYDDGFLRDADVQERPAADVLRSASAYLESRSGSERPLFVWVHLYDAHTPYDAPEPFRSRFPGDGYGAEIAYIDASLGTFFDGIRDLDRFVVSILADHGEALGEHGESTHGALLYESTLHVPWLVRLPGGRHGGVAIESPVRTVDVAPTMLGLLGAPALEEADGVDLSSCLDGSPCPSNEPYAETEYLHLLLGWSELRSLRRGPLKVIAGARTEVFDLESDPGETRDLSTEHRPDAEALVAELERTAGAPSGPSREAILEDQDAARLQALGYVSGTTRAPGPGRDPRDGMDVWREIESGTSLLPRDRRAARGHFERALALDPENGLALKSLGDVRLLDGKPDEALELYARSSASGFAHPDLDLGRARALGALGRIDEADEVLSRVLDARPENVDALVLKGRALRSKGGTAEAEAVLKRAVTLLPRDGAALNELGAALADLGRREEAREMFERALAASPDAAAPRRNLAVLLEGAEAERLLREAVELEPDYAEARMDLARRLAEGGRIAEAESQIEVALRLRPRDPEVVFIAARTADLGGRRERARSLYGRFLSLAPNEMGEAREAARRRLADLGGPP